MMALLDKPEGPYIIPILTEIAKNYPQVSKFILPQVLGSLYIDPVTQYVNRHCTFLSVSVQRTCLKMKAAWLLKQ